MSQDTDRDWNALAEIDPYWAVLTHDEFRGAVATDRDKLNAFLESGRAYVNHIWDAIEAARGGRFSPERALDFGCGVGRIAIPLAARCGTVVGLDVADRMLAGARELCEQLGVRNVQFVKADDDLTQVHGTFDLVHSYIVFQHISPERGLLPAAPAGEPARRQRGGRAARAVLQPRHGVDRGPSDEDRVADLEAPVPGAAADADECVSAERRVPHHSGSRRAGRFRCCRPITAGVSARSCVSGGAGTACIRRDAAKAHGVCGDHGEMQQRRHGATEDARRKHCSVRPAPA